MNNSKNMTYVSIYSCCDFYFCVVDRCSDIQTKQLRDFRALSMTAQRQLQESSEVMHLPKGSIVFEEDQYLNKLYCIKKGACKFSKFDDSGQEHILRFLGEGDLMGKRAFISQKGARVVATTLTPSKICCLEKEAVLRHMKENTAFCKDLLEAFVEDANLSDQTRVIFSPSKSIRGRLAKLLLYISEKFGTDCTGKLRLRMRREDMAIALGTSPEYVINLLKNLKKVGVIQTIKSEIQILSKSGLERISNT
ncbi:MAG: Crp/Fnr family transcriptional regulator [Bacteroidota bacterium]